MYRSYEYHGFTVEVSVDVDVIRIGASVETRAAPGYVPVVTISREGKAMAAFSPLRFSGTCCNPFATEIDALMGGFSAGRQIVDDLVSST
ncbi:hypothetical protein PWR63_30300 [Paraburkholderia sp. A2WS-5]|jgi:hypothetical protein|uniref:hypothetical protein n=1 Tax=unclassified Paraburkholderia TaxID=2615204 RepID=UPI003B762BF1